ncbi:MAG: prepilin-type N-terminal cleavage/methylation domain-containing protein [Candidatus Gastranaerophilales bacterium]|nr:prepilin-type N-terminal cleavage/methylation domain-containing protein [Candidatus Gastranaerophilales bacterium]
MNKGFTLSEALITLVVLGVISAITIPLLSKQRPDKDEIMYKKALYTVNMAMPIIMEKWDSETYKNKSKKFCLIFFDYVNTAEKSANCNATSSYDSPNFTTTDGIRFWGLEKISDSFFDKDASSSPKVIMFDRILTDGKEYDSNGQLTSTMASNRERTDTKAGLGIGITKYGKLTTPPGDYYSFERSLFTQATNAAD